ncbi:MAG: LA2681 family HEPN domain-containing protein [Chloroflexi bacterium]|nr:LA2681 family HEPN domain-containing protein [Chloroflexota bacterium]
MQSLTIDSIAKLEEAGHRLFQLLDEGDASGALEFAKSLRADPGQELPVEHFLGCAYVEVGGQLKSVDLVDKGVRILSELDPKRSATISYNLANAKSQLWKIAVNQNGLSTAWLEMRCQLRDSRKLYESVANDDNADIEQRLKAFTDWGNSYDNQGRYLDALDCYDQALRLDPSYGMALGNRGMALFFAAPLMGEHQSHILLEAATNLDAAIENEKSVLNSGGRQALEVFEKCRAYISTPSGTPLKPKNNRQTLSDSHLNWCLNNRFFLHISPDCIREDSDVLDPLSFREISFSLKEPRISPDGEPLKAAKEILGAFNAIKQDYITARYLTWLTSEIPIPFQDHVQSITKRAFFWDTLDYASWGVEPGIATIALKAAVDVLDKVAVFVHLYLRSNRNVRSVNFATLPYKNNKGTELEPALANALRTPAGNWNSGLIALIDLSSELEEKSQSHLRKFLQYRHAATHRFFVIHSEGAPVSSEWSEHVSWSDATKDLLCLLKVARRAVLYLTQMIHLHEADIKPRCSGTSYPMTIPFPAYRSELDLIDID